MNRGRIFLFISLFLAATTLCGIARSHAQDFGSLDGTWEGQMKSLDMGDKRTGTFVQRIVIQGQQARVFSVKNGQANEIEWGGQRFHVIRHITNAVIFAINSGHDNEGLWVETWVFAVTQKDRNTLISNWYRVVNNNNLPLSSDHSKFSFAATGELQRR